jgi:tetratricopeptide (TPR) repeat protein
MEELANGSSHAATWAWLALARGQLAAMAQEYTVALEHFNAAIEHARRAHHPIMFASTSVYIAGTLQLRGGPIDAAEYLRALDLVERHGAFEAQVIGYVASHLLAAGGLEPASTLIAYLEARGVQSIEAGWSWPEKPYHPQAEHWWARGAALSLEQAIEYTREALRALTT